MGGGLLALVLLSVVLQFSFLVGCSSLSYLGEAALAGAAVWVLVRGRVQLGEDARACFQEARSFPIVTAVALGLLVYLAALAFLIPPGNRDSLGYHLARVYLFLQEQTLYPVNYTDPRQVMFPVGGDVLYTLLLRHNTDYGVGFVSFISYCAILCGAYRFGQDLPSRNGAIALTCVVAGLQELVYQATSTKNDILMAAVALYSVVLLRRLWKEVRGFDLTLFVAMVAYGISVKPTFAVVAGSLLLFFVLTSARRVGMRECLRRVWLHKVAAASAVAGFAVLSQSWFYAFNRAHFGAWAGPEEYLSRYLQKDGALGALANLVRYAFQSLDCLTPVDLTFAALLGRRLTDMLTATYYALFDGLWGNAGNPSFTFNISWQAHEDIAWQGPLGWLLLLPATVYALRRGTLYVRAVAVTAVIYAVALSWQLTWDPWHGRFFTTFFVLTVPCLAFWMKQGQLSRGQSSALAAVGCCLWLYAALLNQGKPMFPRSMLGDVEDGWEQKSVWSATGFGLDRGFYHRQLFGDDRVDVFSKVVRSGATIAVEMCNHWLYPYLHTRPDVRFLPFDRIAECGPSCGADSGLDYTLCYAPSSCFREGRSGRLLWAATSDNEVPAWLASSKDYSPCARLGCEAPALPYPP